MFWCTGKNLPLWSWKMNLGLLNLISFKLLAKQKLCECKLHWKMVRKSCEILSISEISQIYFDILMKIQILLQRKKTSVWYDKYFLKTRLYNKPNKNEKKLKLHLTAYWLFLFFLYTRKKVINSSFQCCLRAFACFSASSPLVIFQFIDQREKTNKLNCTLKKKSLALFWLFSLFSIQKIQIYIRKRLKITDNPTEIAI